MGGILHSTTMKWLGLLTGSIVTMLFLVASIILGYHDISLQTSIDAFLHFDGSQAHLVIIDVRFPRSIIALTVGFSLGISGVLLQAVTKNPLADLSIFGLNAGAAFFVVASIFLFSVSSLLIYSWFAFAGAALTGLLVFLIGQWSADEHSPVNLALVGAALTAFFGSATHGLLTVNNRTLEEVIFWLAGSVADRDLALLYQTLPLFIIAWIGAWLLGKPIQTLLLGDEVATGLGQRVLMVRIFIGLVIVLLAGCTVSITGPIGFIGLVAPHLARYLTGNHIQWTILFAGIIGATLLLLADLTSRLISTTEIPIGVMTALIGTPFFIAAVRKGWRAS